MTRKENSSSPLVPTKSERQNQSQGWVDVPKLTAAEKLESVISVRFDADATALVRRAAILLGGSRSDFVRAASLSEAQRVIREHETRSVLITRVDAPTFAMSAQPASIDSKPKNGSNLKTRSAKAKVTQAE